MRASASKTRLLIVTLSALSALGGGLYVLGGQGREAEATPVAVPEAHPTPAASVSLEPVPLIPPVEIEISAEELARTTVLWPVRVELDLIEAFYLPTEQGLAPIGSGASARLRGRIMGPGDRGARATIQFLAGANEGRVLYTDVTGTFGATDLYPGLSIVEVRGEGIIGSRREVRLRQERESLLNIGYGRPGSAQGRVQDREGVGLAGARVIIDGTRVVTGPDGEFALSAVAAGQVLVEVEMEGYAAYQELAWIAAGQENRKDRLTFTLEPAASLRIAVSNNVGGPGPVQLVLLPGQESRRVHSASAHRNMRFPWHRRNPIEIRPGTPMEIEGLPPEVVKVYAFRPGARSKLSVVNLKAGYPYNLTIALEPAPKITGRVLHEGQPVADALVRLEAPNRVRATLSFFRQPSHYLESAVMPPLPPAVQETRTDARGRYVLTAWAEESPTRFLEARGPAGRTWAGRLVQRGEEAIDLNLEEVDLANSELSVEFPGRWQGLPLEVLVEGSPFDPWILPPTEELVLRELLSGRWHLRISWHGAEILAETLEVRGQVARKVTLIPECIEGQDEEAWRRAGKVFPGT